MHPEGRAPRRLTWRMIALICLALAATAAPSALAARLAPGSPAKAPAPKTPLQAGWRGSGHAVTITFGGDVHFEGPIAPRLASDPKTALGAPVRSLLSGGQISMVNLESAITHGEQCPVPQPKTYVFHAPPTALTALKSAGVTVATEANNHGEDCGLPGLEQSLSIEHAAHFPVVGIGQNAAAAYAPYRTTVNGQRIAIIAATQVIDPDLVASWSAGPSHPGVASAFQVGRLVHAVKVARRTSDTVIVYLHWGTETEQCPNSLQEPLARALVKAGADIVLGTHAHVQLGAGYLGSAFVDYGLGNFAFYDETPPESISGSLSITITGRHVDRYRWRPAVIHSGLPIAQHGAAAGAARAHWRSLRGCTNLAAQAGRSLSSPATERP